MRQVLLLYHIQYVRLKDQPFWILSLYKHFLNVLLILQSANCCSLLSVQFGTRRDVCVFISDITLRSKFCVVCQGKKTKRWIFLCCRFSMIWCDRSTEKRRWKRRRQRRSRVAHCSKMPSHSSSGPGRWVLKHNLFQTCTEPLLLSQLCTVTECLKVYHSW